MTDPLEEWYRAAIAETMRPCPQYVPGGRSDGVRGPRQHCPVCGGEFALNYIRIHRRKAHPESVDNPGEIAS